MPVLQLPLPILSVVSFWFLANRSVASLPLSSHRLLIVSDVGLSCAVIAGMERFVFKGVASNLVIYLTDVMKMSSSSAARTVNSWCSFTSMLPLLVAPLVDSYGNSYSTVLASSFLYLVGLLALTSTALNKSKSSSSSSSLFCHFI